MWSGSLYAYVARVHLGLVYSYALSSFLFKTGLDGGTGFTILLRTWSPVFGFVPMYQEYFAFAGNVFSRFPLPFFFLFFSFFFLFFM